MVLAIVLSAISPLVSILTLLPIRRRFGYFFYSTKYDRDMRAKKIELDATATDMNNEKVENDVKNVMVPKLVPNWLLEAEAIIRKAEEIIDKDKESNSSFSRDGNGCLHMNIRRYKVGKRCYKVIKDIERLMIQRSNMKWTDKEILLTVARSATPHAVFQDVPQNLKSRQAIFEKALQLLEPDNPTQIVALCGMGGIGKTTMMEQLKEVVTDRKVFDRVVPVVIGNITGPIAFQDAVAQEVGGKLSESAKETRAERLKQRFLGMSEHGKKKILIILDNLWNPFELKDIGLKSPLPKCFKLLLTSRYEKLCDPIGDGSSSILKMDPLKLSEAKKLFWEIMKLPEGAVDHQKVKLGEDIVKRCGGLPIAIDIIARALRTERVDEWNLTLTRLKRHNQFPNLQSLYAVVQDIFEISYDFLKNNDDKEIFILSGLFPNDFDIPLEDLMRYGWGLKLFVNVYSLVEARQRTNTSVHNLIRANLLIESDRKGCVKMHDLARSFVLSNISKFKQASIVNHGDMSEWPKQDIRHSCERILVKCKGMSEFPQQFDYPDLKLLKLMMNEKEPLMFPDDFYTEMKKLQVISYRSILYPSLPISLQCSTSLRMLCLRSCSLTGDLSFLGHLTNLEILSLAYCRIKYLPSTMEKLTKLKLLDLTGSDKLCIDDGVFQKLNNLEELYLRNSNEKVISFTEDNCKGLERVSKKLTALEVEFFKNNIRPDRVSFKKLERFRISIGCHLDHIYDNDVVSYENTLRLVGSYKEVRAFEIEELFGKTEKLHLQVEDIKHIEDVLMHPSQYSFCNLKHLSFEKCANLSYLFTVNVASTLTNLERLTVKSCGVLESLIYDEKNRAEVIKFHKLKRLVLEELSMFVGLCDNINIVMELPQLVELRLAYLPKFTCIFSSSKNISATTIIPLLNKKVMSPKLEELEIIGMNLKEIWGCEEEDDRTPMLKQIEVEECDQIENLFPNNPMRLLSHLEKLVVINCGSIRALFNIDSKCVGQVNSCLKSIRALGLPELKEVWSIRDEDDSVRLIRDFQSLEFIQINGCKNFRNIVTPATIKFDMGALIDITIDLSEEEWGTNSRLIQYKETEILDDSMVAVPSSFIHTLHHVSNMKLCMLEQVKVIFDIHIPSAGIVAPNQGEKQVGAGSCGTSPNRPRCNELSIARSKIFRGLYSRISSNKSNKPYPGSAPTHNDDEQPLLLPCLTDIKLSNMKNMTHLWRCNWRKFLMLQNSQQKSSFQNLTNIYMMNCDTIEYLFSPLMATLLSNLKKVDIKNCERIQEVVSNRDDEDDIPMGTPNNKLTVVTFHSLKSIILAELPNLKGFFCGKNELHLRLLDEVVIKNCPQVMELTSLPFTAPNLKYMEINDDRYIPSYTLPSDMQTPSQSLDNKFHNLIERNLDGDREKCRVIFTYDELLQLQNLEKLNAKSCESVVEVFDIGTGGVTVVKLPKLRDVNLWALRRLKYIWNSNGPTILEFPNLTKLYIYNCEKLEHAFTCSMVGSLMQLKELHISLCPSMEVIVKEDQGEEEKEEEGGSDGKVNNNEVIRLPCLKKLILISLGSLEGFCLGNVGYSFPSLVSMEIKNCRSLTMFTNGGLYVPELKVVWTSLGDINVAEKEDINSFIITKRQEGFRF
uniref:disease resistance protein At4g27190-like n=1 Tax=Erigeron canadensis TaxID=72917 RepID=UPI001CB8A2C4|nr:disease resistance protein At4g27190-like [Erigeron canadensis]